MSSEMQRTRTGEQLNRRVMANRASDDQKQLPSTFQRAV